MTLLAVGLLAISFACSAILTAIIRPLAMRFGFVARPANDRYHRSVIPLGGGIAIFWTVALTLLAGIGIIYFVVAPGRWPGLGANVTIHAAGFVRIIPSLLMTLAVMLFLHLVGLWDDRKRLGPYTKLILQFAAAFVLAGFAGVRVHLFIHNHVITTILSAIWIVFLINSFNFLDNMDGLSAGIAVIVSGVLLTAAVMSGQVFVGAFAIILIGALLGFLVFNFPPARIFMGDSGSLVLGMCLGVLTIRTTYYHEAQSGSAYAVLMPLVVMAVPFYDFISVTLLRISQGKSPLIGDTQHFSHRLKRRGLTDRQVAISLYLATLCTGLGATFLHQVNLTGALLIFAQTIMILGIIAVLEMTDAK